MHNIFDTLTNVFAAYSLKITVAVFAVLANIHIHLLAVFALLVALDTVTKWIAISYSYNQCHSMFDAIRLIPQAHRARAIDSHEMRTGFYTKMITYLVLVAAAFLVDSEFFTLNNSPVFVKLVVTYLSVTELLSITENLNDAGISCLSNLLELIKRKGGATR